MVPSARVGRPGGGMIPDLALESSTVLLGTGGGGVASEGWGASR